MTEVLYYKSDEPFSGGEVDTQELILPQLNVVRFDRDDPKQLYLRNCCTLVNNLSIWIEVVKKQSQEMSGDLAGFIDWNLVDGSEAENLQQLIAYNQSIVRQYINIATGSRKELDMNQIRQSSQQFQDLLPTFKFLQPPHIPRPVTKVIISKNTFDETEDDLPGAFHDLTKVIYNRVYLTQTWRDKGVPPSSQVAKEFQRLLRGINTVELQLKRAVEALTGQLLLEDINVNWIMEQVNDLIDEYMDPEHVEVRIDENLQVAPHYSQSRIRGLITNLFTNSKESISEKWKLDHSVICKNRVILQKGTLKNGKSCLEMVYEDNGLGLPDEIIKHGFKMGLSLNSHGKPKGDGIGMASHMKFLIEHGGEMDLENIIENGQVVGSRITVRYP